MLKESMVSLAPPGDTRTIEEELTADKMLCTFKELEIYIVSAENSPALMTEVGRIREREYRRVGAGRNLPVDIDHYDKATVPYRQLVAWDPVYKELVAMYRYIFCRDALKGGDTGLLRTSELFSFSPDFVADTLPAAVELGRSVVNQDARRAILGLFAVWTGLGAMIVEHPEVHWFFGNVSVYRDWPQSAVDLLLAYLNEFHGARPGQVIARPDKVYRSNGVTTARDSLFSGVSREDGYDLLVDRLAESGLAPPPILLSYLRATTELLVYDCAEDGDFGGALEIAITVSTKKLTPKTKRRFVESYTPLNGGGIL